MTNHSIACPAVSVTPPIVASLTVCPALQLMTSIVDWGVPWVLCSEHCGVWGMGVGGVGLGHTPLAGFCAHERVPGRADMWFVVFSHCPHCLPTATPPVLGGHLGVGGLMGGGQCLFAGFGSVALCSHECIWPTNDGAAHVVVWPRNLHFSQPAGQCSDSR